MERVIVNAEALALQSHDPLDEVVAGIVPPIVDGPSVQPKAAAPQLPPALVGPTPVDAFSAVPISNVKPSVTAPGKAPPPSSWSGGALAPSRRSLEQRRSEGMDCSAMTPQAFVKAARKAPPPNAWNEPSRVRIQEVVELPDQSSGAGPRSFAPPKPDPQTDV